MRPILLAASSVNQMEPSGPAAIPCGWALGVGREYSEMAPEVVMRPSWSPTSSVNQRAPSAPAAMPVGPSFFAGSGYSAMPTAQVAPARPMKSATARVRRRATTMMPSRDPYWTEPATVRPAAAADWRSCNFAAVCACLDAIFAGGGAEGSARPSAEVAVTKPVFLMLAMALACGGASGLGADEPPARVEVGESIDVRVVNVEAVVTDRRGHPVRGLAAADFQLLVDGREVPIDYFTEIRDGQAAEKAAATPPPAGAPAAAATAPTPQVSPGATVGRSYLVFVDDAFAVAARRNAALQRLREELRRLGPGDQMAVIV